MDHRAFNNILQYGELGAGDSTGEAVERSQPKVIPCMRMLTRLQSRIGTKESFGSYAWFLVKNCLLYLAGRKRLVMLGAIISGERMVVSICGWRFSCFHKKLNNFCRVENSSRTDTHYLCFPAEGRHISSRINS